MVDSNKQKRSFDSKEFWFGILLLLAFYASYIIMGQDSVWYANDYLELVVHSYRLLIENEAIFMSNDFLIGGMLDQLPRGSFPSEFYMKTWLFYFFEPFEAILINKLLIHAIAYLSAYYFFSKVSKDFIIGPIYYYSLLWACIPFWPEAGIGLAFIPIIYIVFYDLAKGGRLNVEKMFFIIFYCLYSHFHLNGIFIVILIFLLGSIDYFKNRIFKHRFWIVWAMLTLTFLLVNYRLFDIYYFQRDWFVPHRLEYDIYSFARYHNDFWDKMKQILLFGEVHAVFVSPLLYITVAVFLVVSKFFNSDQRKFSFLLKGFIVVNTVAVIAVLLTYLPVVERLPILVKINQFSFERFYYLIYSVLIFLFVLVVDDLLYRSQFKKTGWMLFVSVLAYNFFVLEDNIKNTVTKQVLGMGEKYPTYYQFYAEGQFNHIKNFLDLKSGQNYKVASIGMHPAIATYNGLHSIDGYTGNYSLGYKNEIFEIIHDEIGSEDRDNDLYWHFKGWGNKAYLFNQTHEDDFMRFKWLEEIPVANPKYNYKKLKSIGCHFILSANPIVDGENLILLKKFVDKDSAWNIYVYELV